MMEPPNRNIRNDLEICLSLPKIIRTAIIAFLISICSIVSTAQVPISTTEYLKSAVNEPSFQLENRRLDYLRNTDFELPLVDELEFRTETDEFEWKRQEYLFRLSFNGYQQHLKQGDYHKSLIELGLADQKFILHQNLMKKYFNLTNFIFQLKEIEQKEKEKLVIEDQILVAKKLGANSTRLDLDDLVDAEEDLFEIEIELIEMTEELAFWKKEFAVDLQTNNPINIDTSNLLKVSEIKSILNQFIEQKEAHPRIQQKHRRIDKAISEYELEKSEDNQFVDFIQLQYSGPRKSLNFGQEWSIGAGFRIPTKSANKLNLNELELERIEEENELQLYKIRIAENIERTQNRLDILFKQYDKIQLQIENSQANFALERLNYSTQKNPLILLQIQENILKRQKRILDIEKKIFQSYLNLLDLTGQASELPLRNYLLTGLPLFN